MEPSLRAYGACPADIVVFTLLHQFEEAEQTYLLLPKSTLKAPTFPYPAMHIIAFRNGTSRTASPTQSETSRDGDNLWFLVTVKTILVGEMSPLQVSHDKCSPTGGWLTGTRLLGR